MNDIFVPMGMYSSLALCPLTLDILAWLHAKPLVHDDVNPDNIKLIPTPVVRGTTQHSVLIDFGAALD